MPSSPRRVERVAEAIREEVARFLAEEAKDPRIRGFVTVTGADVTSDLRHSNVFVSILGSDDDRSATLAGLASLASHLRPYLGRTLRLRVAPEVAFRLDESIAHASRIESLLASIRSTTPPPDAEPTD